MKKNKPERIIFLDILRLTAVILMIEGHSIDVFLAEEFRVSTNSFYNIWNWLRGITAPIFFFTAGTLSAYLLSKKNTNAEQRRKKGIRRGIILIITGYLLRYPTHTIFYFGDVTVEQWKIFFSVDALHTIGSGLIFLAILNFISEYVNIKPITLNFLSALFIFAVSPIINSVNWSLIFHESVAGYFYYGTGSIFPLFPWLGFIFSGSVFGCWLAQRNIAGFRLKEISVIIFFSLTLFILGYIFQHLEYSIFPGTSFKFSHTAMQFNRLGIVLILIIFASLLFKDVINLPSFLNKVSQNSLFIYISHLIILYGCVWFPGLNKYIGKSFTIFESLILTIIIYLLVILLLFAKEKLVIRIRHNHGFKR